MIKTVEDVTSCTSVFAAYNISTSTYSLQMQSK